MPPKSTIELGSGNVYFKGLNEPFEISEIETTNKVEWVDDKQYIRKPNAESFTITLDDVQMPREWVLAECKYCGFKFPVTEFYAIMFGTRDWTCPRCAFKRRLEDAKYRHELHKIIHGD